MTLAALHAEDQAYAISEVPVVMSIGGQSVTGTRSSWRTVQDLTDGGVVNNRECEFTALISAMSSPPTLSQREHVTLEGYDCLVMDKGESADNVSVVITLRRVDLATEAR